MSESEIPVGAEASAQMRAEFDRANIISIVREVVSANPNVVALPNSGLRRMTTHEDADIAVNLGHTSVRIRLTVGAKYPLNLVEFMSDLRSSITDALQTKANVLAKRVDIEVAYLAYVDSDFKVGV